MDKRFNLKFVFWTSLIASLVVSALIAILVFLFGDFGETEIKLLLTTLTVGGYSLTGLCSSALYDKRKNVSLVFSGFLVSILGFIITVGAIWKIIDFVDIWRLVAIFSILAFSIAHSSLILLICSEKRIISISKIAMIIFILIIAIMLIYLVLAGFNGVDKFYYRLLGVFAVLDVLGTILTPILKKANN